MGVVEPTVDAIKEGNIAVIVVLGVLGAMWLADKIVFYISKWRNSIPIAHARSGVLDDIRRDQGKLSSVVKDLATATNLMAHNFDKVSDKLEDDLSAIKLTLHEIRNTTSRIDRRSENTQPRLGSLGG